MNHKNQPKQVNLGQVAMQYIMMQRKQKIKNPNLRKTIHHNKSKNFHKIKSKKFKNQPNKYNLNQSTINQNKTNQNLYQQLLQLKKHQKKL